MPLIVTFARVPSLGFLALIDIYLLGRVIPAPVCIYVGRFSLLFRVGWRYLPAESVVALDSFQTGIASVTAGLGEWFRKPGQSMQAGQIHGRLH